MASKYVQAYIANIAKSNPEFAVHHAMFTANKSLQDQYNVENSSPVIENLSQHMGGELPGYTPSQSHPETQPSTIHTSDSPQQQENTTELTTETQQNSPPKPVSTETPSS